MSSAEIIGKCPYRIRPGKMTPLKKNGYITVFFSMWDLWQILFHRGLPSINDISMTTWCFRMFWHVFNTYASRLFILEWKQHPEINISSTKHWFKEVSQMVIFVTFAPESHIEKKNCYIYIYIYILFFCIFVFFWYGFLNVCMVCIVCLYIWYIQ